MNAFISPPNNHSCSGPNHLDLAMEGVHFSIDAYHIYPDGSSEYRLVFEDINDINGIRYIYIAAGVLPSKTLINFACHPNVVKNVLPPFPAGFWNFGNVVRGCSSDEPGWGCTSLDSVPSIHPKDQWHSKIIDHTELTCVKRLRQHIRVVTCPQFRGKVLYKFAALPKDVTKIAAETRVYQRINANNSIDRLRPPWAPRFLAHVKEHGSVTGFLIEYVRGRQPRGAEDLNLCLQPLIRQHEDAEYLHGQISKSNFLIRKMRRSDGEEIEASVLLDFRRAEDLQPSERELRKEKEKDDLRRLLERGFEVLKEEDDAGGWKQ